MQTWNMYTIESVNIVGLLAGVQYTHTRVWLVQSIEFMLQYLYKTNDLIRILSALFAAKQQ